MPRDFQDRRRLRHPLYSPWGAGLLLLLLVFLARGVYKNFVTREQTKDDLTAVRRELADLEDRRASLLPRTERLKTSEGIDEEIRKNFPVALSGERVVVVIDGEEAASSAPTTTKTTGFWVRKMLGF